MIVFAAVKAHSTVSKKQEPKGYACSHVLTSQSDRLALIKWASKRCLQYWRNNQVIFKSILNEKLHFLRGDGRFLFHSLLFFPVFNHLPCRSMLAVIGLLSWRVCYVVLHSLLTCCFAFLVNVCCLDFLKDVLAGVCAQIVWFAGDLNRIPTLQGSK